MNGNEDVTTAEVASQLLNVPGRQWKICLENLTAAEFVGTMELIESHGGRLVNAHDAGVVVLTWPDRAPTTGHHRFHINWLFDSVIAGKLQDLAKYLLTPKNQNSSSDPPVKVKEQPSERPQETPDSTVEEIKIVEMNNSHSSGSQTTHHTKHSADPSQSIKPELSGEYHRGRKYSEAEDREMINFLIRKNGMHRAGGNAIWKEMENEKILPGRTAKGLCVHFTRVVRHKVRRYTNDATILAELKLWEKKCQAKSTGRHSR